MKLEADVRELIAKLQATLGQHVTAGGCDHACRPKCPVCAERGRARDLAMSRAKERNVRARVRAGTIGQPAPDEVVFRGFREGDK